MDTSHVTSGKSNNSVTKPRTSVFDRLGSRIGSPASETQAVEDARSLLLDKNRKKQDDQEIEYRIVDRGSLLRPREVFDGNTASESGSCSTSEEGDYLTETGNRGGRHRRHPQKQQYYHETRVDYQIKQPEYNVSQGMMREPKVKYDRHGNPIVSPSVKKAAYQMHRNDNNGRRNLSIEDKKYLQVKQNERQYEKRRIETQTYSPSEERRKSHVEDLQPHESSGKRSRHSSNASSSSSKLPRVSSLHPLAVNPSSSSCKILNKDNSRKEEKGTERLECTNYSNSDHLRSSKEELEDGELDVEDEEEEEGGKVVNQRDIDVSLEESRRREERMLSCRPNETHFIPLQSSTSFSTKRDSKRNLRQTTFGFETRNPHFSKNCRENLKATHSNNDFKGSRHASDYMNLPERDEEQLDPISDDELEDIMAAGIDDNEEGNDRNTSCDRVSSLPSSPLLQDYLSIDWSSLMNKTSCSPSSVKSILFGQHDKHLDLQEILSETGLSISLAGSSLTNKLINRCLVESRACLTKGSQEGKQEKGSCTDENNEEGGEGVKNEQQATDNTKHSLKHPDDDNKDEVDNPLGVKNIDCSQKDSVDDASLLLPHDKHPAHFDFNINANDHLASDEANDNNCSSPSTQDNRKHHEDEEAMDESRTTMKARTTTRFVSDVTGSARKKSSSSRLIIRHEIAILHSLIQRRDRERQVLLKNLHSFHSSHDQRNQVLDQFKTKILASSSSSSSFSLALSSQVDQRLRNLLQEEQHETRREEGDEKDKREGEDEANLKQASNPVIEVENKREGDDDDDGEVNSLKKSLGKIQHLLPMTPSSSFYVSGSKQEKS